MNMNVSLTDELGEFVNAKVSSGRYTSASEVVREALRLLEERDRIRQLQIRELRKKINSGWSSLERGSLIGRRHLLLVCRATRARPPKSRYSDA